MPIFMDVHIIPGVKARDVAQAHQVDMLHQHEFNCKCMTYWIDEARESVFCLIEAPQKEVVAELHSRAHGLVPNKIIEVNNELVESFLGRIYDPPDAQIADGLKIINDPSFRILLLTKITDPFLLRYKFGAEKTTELLNRYTSVVRKNLSLHHGQEVEHGGHEFIISFTSATKAIDCALSIQKEISIDEAKALGLKTGINAGEPIAKSNQLFGDTIQLAGYLCAIAKDTQIAVASSVKELLSRDRFQRGGNNFFTLSPQDEALLELLFTKLHEHWQDPDFDVDDFSHATTMSKSQLYRKTIALTGLSPNILLKEFRLEKALELIKKQRYSVAQITFESGFTSPSYFTKCFKAKYNLLPMAYLDMLH